MPSINEVIERVSRARVDAYDDATKAQWIIEAEGQIYRQTALTHGHEYGTALYDMRVDERGHLLCVPLRAPETVRTRLYIDGEGRLKCDAEAPIAPHRFKLRFTGRGEEKRPEGCAPEPCFEATEEGRLLLNAYVPYQPVRKWPEDGDKQLMVEPPYDRLYDLYIFAQTDFYNREMEEYNNSAAAYNAALDEYKKEYHRTHYPHDGRSFLFVF